MVSKIVLSSLALASTLLLGSCQAMYLSAMETIGVDKREIMFERIEDASDAAVISSQRIDEAYQIYRGMIFEEAGDLYEAHDLLTFFLELCHDGAEDYQERIEKIQAVATPMFEEWKAESGEIHDDELRRKGRTNFTKAVTQYEQLMRAMRDVDADTTPLLNRFRDHVLFMKINLNTNAWDPLRKHDVDFANELSMLTRRMDVVQERIEKFLNTVSY
ncbi:MAG: hypothetical protein ACI8TQ_002186 [Planctomycetota bacterium]|jgi:hypothetical protein